MPSSLGHVFPVLQPVQLLGDCAVRLSPVAARHGRQQPGHPLPGRTPQDVLRARTHALQPGSHGKGLAGSITIAGNQTEHFAILEPQIHWIDRKFHRCKCGRILNNNNNKMWFDVSKPQKMCRSTNSKREIKDEFLMSNFRSLSTRIGSSSWP